MAPRKKVTKTTTPKKKDVVLKGRIDYTITLSADSEHPKLSFNSKVKKPAGTTEPQAEKEDKLISIETRLLGITMALVELVRFKESLGSALDPELLSDIEGGVEVLKDLLKACTQRLKVENGLLDQQDKMEVLQNVLKQLAKQMGVDPSELKGFAISADEAKKIAKKSTKTSKPVKEEKEEKPETGEIDL